MEFNVYDVQATYTQTRVLTREYQIRATCEEDAWDEACSMVTDDAAAEGTVVVDSFATVDQIFLSEATDVNP